MQVTTKCVNTTKGTSSADIRKVFSLLTAIVQRSVKRDKRFKTNAVLIRCKKTMCEASAKYKIIFYSAPSGKSPGRLWTRAFHYIHEHPHTGTRHLGTNKQTKEEMLSELNSSLDVKYRAVNLPVSWNYFNDHSRGEFRLD